jgi:hypothetical protein
MGTDVGPRSRRANRAGRLEESRRCRLVLQQRFNLLPQRCVALTGILQERVALLGASAALNRLEILPRRSAIGMGFV